MSQTTRAAQRIQIGIIANSQHTASQLMTYLSAFGIAAQRSSLSFEISSDEESSLQAIVIFPDDFAPEHVDHLLEHLARQHPALFQLIVTQKPQRFNVPPGAASPTPQRVVLPRPTFGWQIVDAIRAHLEGEAGVEH